MHYLGLSLILVLSAVLYYTVFTQRSLGVKENIKSSSVKSSPTSVSPTPSPSVNPSLYAVPSPSVIPNSSNNFSEFVYPHAISLNSDNTIFQSLDDAVTITNWYKEKIKSLKMNTTSFIQTNTNGNIINKLVGSNGKRQVEIDISKKSSQAETKIDLNVNN